jgi:hypothetical protein
MYLFLSAFPMFVPSLSWQNDDHFQHEMATQKEGVFRTLGVGWAIGSSDEELRFRKRRPAEKDLLSPTFSMFVPSLSW